MQKLLKIHVGPLNNDGPLLILERSLLFKHIVMSLIITHVSLVSIIITKLVVFHSNMKMQLRTCLNSSLGPRNVWSKIPLSRLYFQTQDWT